MDLSEKTMGVVQALLVVMVLLPRLADFLFIQCRLQVGESRVAASIVVIALVGIMVARATTIKRYLR